MLPSGIDSHISVFDRFATWTSNQVARAPFFVACVALIAVWPVCFVVFDVDTAQLIINTATTIVTFLLVALLQNSQHRSDAALQHKLNAIAESLTGLVQDEQELHAAVGLEDRESS